jgi:hypothetical protein
VSGREVKWSLTRPLEALHDDRRECYWSVVIQFSYFHFLGTVDIWKQVGIEA